ncbi:MAG: Gfo/Idh/MocA family oxidoreductase [Candidatus Buchananbacteria bacterium]
MGIKIGIIGAGGMVPYHVAGFRQAGAEVVAIADTVPDKVDAAMFKYSILRGDSTAESLLGIDELDAVSIITPNMLHAPLAIAALEAGKHVYCEKPPTLNAIEMYEVARAAEKAGLIWMAGLNNRHRPEAEILKMSIESGGSKQIDSHAGGQANLRSGEAYWVRRAGIPGFGTWFTNRSQSGGGCTIDLLHMLDLAWWLMGCPKPSDVLARTFDDFHDDPKYKGPWGIVDGTGPTDVETAAHAMVTFTTGQCLQVHTSWAEMVERERVGVKLQGATLGACLERVFGQDGLDDTAKDSLHIFREGPLASRDDSHIVCRPDPAMGRIAGAAHFIRVIEGKEEPRNTPDQALMLMLMVDAIYQSSRTRSSVRIG